MLSLIKFAEIVTLDRLLTVMQTHFQNVSDDNSIKGSYQISERLWCIQLFEQHEVIELGEICWHSVFIFYLLDSRENKGNNLFRFQSYFLHIRNFGSHSTLKLSPISSIWRSHNDLVLKQKSPPKKFCSFKLHQF